MPADAPQPMTPEQSAAAFKLPDGFRMDVVASEPLIASPSAVCWDERGRMFVSELHGYNLAGQLDIEELNKTGKLDTQVRRVQADEKFKRAAMAGTFGVVKWLRDMNGDGRMDQADVFATNLPPIYGLVPARGGIIVACAPDIVFLADRDGDGTAETREVLFSGFPTGELERGINAPQWSVDGWIYFGRGWGGGKITGPHLREPVQLPGSDFRIRADGSAIEPVTGATHTFGFAITEAGDRFTVTTTTPGIFIAPLPWRYLARNPDAATPSLESATGDRRAYSISKPHPWRQQYGVYAGHDRGRIYRLTHRDAPRSPAADMSTLDPRALAAECASPLLWRRQTAQRLLVERQETSAAPLLRKILTDKASEPSGLVAALRTLAQLGALAPSDLAPFIRHTDAAVRIHALQLADPWFVKTEGRALLDATLAAAPAETNARVQIQFALSLGETRDPRAFAMLARFAREKLSVRWMDAALLSSLQGRGLEMFAELRRDPDGRGAAFLPLLAQTVAARRDESEMARTLDLIATAGPATQTNVLNALVKGRKNAPRRPLAGKSARTTLASLAASPVAQVRMAARALEDTFVAGLADDEALVPAGQLPPAEQVSDETFRKFVTALAGPRDRKHGHEVFLRACATCHRVGNEGSDVGPDLIGQLGLAEESLLKDILLPNERIRPGFETALVQTRDGSAITGLIKSDDATSLTLVQAGAAEQVLLRKDVLGVRRLATSLMPSFAEGLNPSDVADLLAWLRSNPGAPTPKPLERPMPEDPSAKAKPSAK